MADSDATTNVDNTRSPKMKQGTLVSISRSSPVSFRNKELAGKTGVFKSLKLRVHVLNFYRQLVIREAAVMDKSN